MKPRLLLVLVGSCLLLLPGCGKSGSHLPKSGNDLLYYDWQAADEKNGISFHRDGTGVVGVSIGGFQQDFTVTRFRYTFVDQNTVELEIGSGWSPPRPEDSTHKLRLNITVSGNRLETTDPDGKTVTYAKRGKPSDH